jgi:hypothetical protein
MPRGASRWPFRHLSQLLRNITQLWKAFETALLRTVAELGLDSEYWAAFASTSRILGLLHEKGVIDEQAFDEGKTLVEFRNRLVHDPSASFSEQAVRSYILRLEAFQAALGRSGSWKGEIVSALQVLGGKATLTEIYDHIESTTLRELPNTWKATVRYTLQLNSPDTETHRRGGEDLFRHLDTGYWGLIDSDESVS